MKNSVTVVIPYAFLMWILGVVGSATLTTGICIHAMIHARLAPVLIYFGALIVGIPPIPMLVRRNKETS